VFFAVKKIFIAFSLKFPLVLSVAAAFLLYKIRAGHKNSNNAPGLKNKAKRMLNWIKNFKKSTGSTKAFWIVNFIFMLSIILTTLYCYARLDYVRSYKTKNDGAENIIP
jgi:hypothetical protein